MQRKCTVKHFNVQQRHLCKPEEGQLEGLNGRLEYFAVFGCYEFNRRPKEGVGSSSLSEGEVFWDRDRSRPTYVLHKTSILWIDFVLWVSG